MIIGTIKEIKNNENRVALTPENVKKLVLLNNEVLIEKNAGIGSGFTDKEYEENGAKILKDPKEIVSKIDLLVKVKEPIEEEYYLLDIMKNKTLFTYLHLAAAPKELTLKLMENKITAIAYETVEDEFKNLPLLKPMSEVAGVLAVQYGCQFMQKKYGGIGKTLGKITNADSANVLIVGGGIVGSKSALTAAGLGCNVTILEINKERINSLKNEFLKYLGEELFSNVNFVESNTINISKETKKADLLIGAVLVKGAKAPTIINEEHLNNMKKGCVIVDVAIDQGGCIYGSKPTTHEKPIYEFKDKIYCCITNMPGQVSMQSTQALSNVVFPYIKKMSEDGIIELLKKDINFLKGLNVYNRKLVNEQISDALNIEYSNVIF